MPFSYLLGILKTILILKHNLFYWTVDCNMERAWLLAEVAFFFNTIWSGMTFMAFCSIIKGSGPFTKDIKKSYRDNNPWNDKSTNDFLRHVKLEYFLFTFQLSLLLTEIVIGFTSLHHMNWFGPRSFDLTGRILLICMMPHLIKLMGYSMLLYYGNDLWGKRKPYMIIQTICSVIGTMMLFTVYYFDQDKL